MANAAFSDGEIKSVLVAQLRAIGWLAEANGHVDPSRATIDARDNDRRLMIVVDAELDKWAQQLPVPTFAERYNLVVAETPASIEAALAVNGSAEVRASLDDLKAAHGGQLPVTTFLLTRDGDTTVVTELPGTHGRVFAMPPDASSSPPGSKGLADDKYRSEHFDDVDAPTHLIAVYIAKLAQRFAEMDADKAELYHHLGIERSAKVNRKTLREEIWYVWHSHTRPAGGKYSPHLPWSPLAIAARAADPRAPLVIDHVLPFALFAEQLEATASLSPASVEALLAGIELVVITADEDRRVTAAGNRNRLPEGSVDPFDRYRPIGLTRADFQLPHPPPDQTQFL